MVVWCGAGSDVEVGVDTGAEVVVEDAVGVSVRSAVVGEDV